MGSIKTDVARLKARINARAQACNEPRRTKITTDDSHEAARQYQEIINQPLKGQRAHPTGVLRCSQEEAKAAYQEVME